MTAVTTLTAPLLVKAVRHHKPAKRQPVDVAITIHRTATGTRLVERWERPRPGSVDAGVWRHVGGTTPSPALAALLDAALAE